MTSAAASPATGAGRRPPIWRQRDFLLLWGGQTISELGTNISQVAIPLVALLTLHVTTFEFGLLTAAETLPFLLIGLPAGAIVDRLRKRTVLLVGDAGRALLLGSIPVAGVFGILTIGQLYAVALAAGVLTVLFDVAYQSYLPALVGRDGLVDGNSKLTATQESARLAGPGLGGVLVGLVGAARTVAADAASFALSFGSLLAIRLREPAPEVPPGRRSLRADIAEGLRFVLSRPLLRRQAGCTGWSNLFSAAAFAILPVYMVRNLHLSPSTIGLVFSLSAVGGLLGALVAPRLSRRLGVGPTAVTAAWLSSTAGLLLPLAARPYAVPMLVLSGILFGLGVTPYNINMVSLRQGLCPPRLQGRMNATMRFIVWGTLPLGGLLGGTLGSTLGLRPGLAVAAAFGLLAPLWITAPVYLRLRDMPGASDDTGSAAAALGPASETGAVAGINPITAIEHPMLAPGVPAGE